MNCNTCGRPLTGLRIDHAFHCALNAQLATPPVISARPRIQILEIDEDDRDSVIPVDWIGPEVRRVA